MTIYKVSVCLVLTLLALSTVATAGPISAPTSGRPLSTVMIPACRVLDTRVSLGPLDSGVPFNLLVRGGSLPPSQGGEEDCGVPDFAEAVVLNIKAVGAAGLGFLVASPDGFPTPTSTLHFVGGSLGVVTSGEVLTALCVEAVNPSGFQACSGADAEITTSADTDLVADVVAYLYYESIR